MQLLFLFPNHWWVLLEFHLNSGRTSSTVVPLVPDYQLLTRWVKAEVYDEENDCWRRVKQPWTPKSTTMNSVSMSLMVLLLMMVNGIAQGISPVYVANLWMIILLSGCSTSWFLINLVANRLPNNSMSIVLNPARGTNRSDPHIHRHIEPTFETFPGLPTSCSEYYS